MYYLMFIFLKKKHYKIDNILCMAEYLFELQHKNRIQQKGLLQRFTLNCIGEQETLESMRLKKSIKYKELTRKSPYWDFYFLKYIPNKNSIKKTKKRKTYRNKTRKIKAFKGWLSDSLST